MEGGPCRPLSLPRGTRALPWPWILHPCLLLRPLNGGLPSRVPWRGLLDRGTKWVGKEGSGESPHPPGVPPVGASSHRLCGGSGVESGHLKRKLRTAALPSAVTLCPSLTPRPTGLPRCPGTFPGEAVTRHPGWGPAGPVSSALRCCPGHRSICPAPSPLLSCRSTCYVREKPKPLDCSFLKADFKRPRGSAHCI